MATRIGVLFRMDVLTWFTDDGLWRKKIDVPGIGYPNKRKRITSGCGRESAKRFKCSVADDPVNITFTEG